METVGWIAVAIFAVLVLIGLVMALMSLPDLARYMRLRRM
jgi:hypothetical protein